jgi:hypothetical protein
MGQITNPVAPRSAKPLKKENKKMEQADSPRSNNRHADLLAELFDRLRQDGKLAELLDSAAHQITARPPHGGLAGDILHGADQIAEFLYGKKKCRRKVYNLVDTGQLPYFRLGASICSRKSVLLAWIDEQEKRRALTSEPGR